MPAVGTIAESDGAVTAFEAKSVELARQFTSQHEQALRQSDLMQGLLLADGMVFPRGFHGREAFVLSSAFTEPPS